MALFGGPRQRNPWDIDPMQQAIGNLQQPMQQPMPQPAPERPRGFWNGGDKFGTRDGIAAVLAVIGDTLAQRGGGQGGAVANLAGGRRDFMDAQQMAQQKAAERQAGIEDYRAKKRIDQQYAAPPSLPSNVQETQWYMQASPQERQMFDTVNPVVSATPYGPMVVPRGGGSGPAPGTVEDGYRFKGGNPADPGAWEKAGGPASAPGTFRYR